MDNLQNPQRIQDAVLYKDVLMHFLNSLRWFVQFLTTDKKSIKMF